MLRQNKVFKKQPKWIKGYKKVIKMQLKSEMQVSWSVKIGKNGKTEKKSLKMWQICEKMHKKTNKNPTKNDQNCYNEKNSKIWHTT